MRYLTPVSVLGVITASLGIVAAANFLYFFNIAVGIIFTILTTIALSITAWVIFDEARDPD